MKRLLTLLTLLVISGVAYSQDGSSGDAKTSPVREITDVKVQTNLNGEDKVVQQYLLPKFKDGWQFQRYRDWVIDNISYPQSCIDEGVSGRVVVVFIIDADGAVRIAEAAQTPDKRLSDELIRVVKSEKWFRSARMWDEEQKKYVSVPMRSVIPITFNLPPKQKESNTSLTYDMMEGGFDGL